jgi:hypothetical protein
LKYCKIEDIANKLARNKERGKNIVRGHGGLKLTKNTMKGKNIVRERGSKLFELYSPIYEIIVKGSKLSQPYLLEGSQKHNEGVEAF